MDLQFLYNNLFDKDETSPEDFNKLVDSCSQLLEVLVQSNFVKEDLDSYLSKQVSAKEDFKKSIQQFWKNEQGRLMKALNPLKASCSGIKDIDWEVHLTTASRHKQNINKQTATVVIQPLSNNKDKIMFEADKEGVKDILDKLSVIETFINLQST